ncbi:hypothetical protein [Streptomyces sp. DG1A-41]|uniref:hypothetical protein n=1 Tax=Streptomyces sp. DG1A-41 TaxID=3125779 RepID=UPI0030CB7C34
MANCQPWMPTAGIASALPVIVVSVLDQSLQMAAAQSAWAVSPLISRRKLFWWAAAMSL